MTIAIPGYIRDLVPYRAGKALEDIAGGKFAKLASNENPLGPSPRALAAARAELDRMHVYPDPSAHLLVRELADAHGVADDEIVCANGSDAVLEYAVMSFTEAGDEILTSHGTFIGLYVIARKLARTLVQVPLQNLGYDLKAISAAVTDRTRVIYLANPNNPTGTHFTRAALQKFLAAVPTRVLVILDEAYAEYALEDPDYPNGLDFRAPNVLILRTFSKVHGLAGLRVGYGIAAPAIAQALAKVKLPFEPNRAAQAAAIQALRDRGFIGEVLRLNRECRDLLAGELRALGVAHVESIANFFCLPFGDEGAALAFHDACAQRGLYLRHLPGFGLPSAVRINTGTVEQTRFAAAVIREVTLAKGHPA